jgi:hypothetical protein
MAAWAEERGFETAICERLFDRHFTRHSDEAAVALCGLDNGLGRQALDQVGFDFVRRGGVGPRPPGFQGHTVAHAPGLPQRQPNLGR